MRARFVLGRAGSGKTYHCHRAIAAALAAEPAVGPRLLLLVPEQASLEAERAILRHSPRGIAHRAEVLSFDRLAQRVLQTVGGPARQALSEPARAMVIRHLLQAHRDELRYFRRVERRPGVMTRLGQAVAELIHEAVTPAGLAAAAEAALTHDDALSAAKLHDLTLLYRAYLEYLGDQLVDPAQYLELARALVPRCRWLTGAYVWVDGFASFTQQEALTLVAVVQQAEAAQIALLSEPALARPGEAARLDIATAELFARTQHTCTELAAMLEDAGVRVEEPICLGEGDALRRFERVPALRAIERHFLQPAPEPVATGDDASPSALRAVVLPDARLEVEYAVACVHEWVRTRPGWRYRDVALIVRDLEPYYELITAALDRRDIPYFIDRRRSVAHHPLVELLRSAVAVAATDMALGAVRPLLKTGLLPLTDAATDELENYLLAQGLEGWLRWSGDDWSFTPRSRLGEEPEALSAAEQASLARVNAARRTLVDVLAPWLASASEGPAPTGGQWAKALRALLDRLDVAQTLSRWAEQAEAEGLLDPAEQHRQTWRDGSAFLEELGLALADTPIRLEELGPVLEAGLASLTLGLTPPMLDQVLVGSIERSRHPELKAVVILGFQEGQFPRLLAEDPVLNDDDRTGLRAAGVTVRPPTPVRLRDEAQLAYVALTRASEELVLTWPAVDAGGQPVRPSPYLAGLQSAWPALAVEALSDPAGARDTWDVRTERDLVRRLAGEFRERPALADDAAAVRARFNELYESVRGDDDLGARLRGALAGLRPAPAERLAPASVKALAWTQGRFSVSQLESYATCPFQYFARYGLRLQQRAEAALEPVDLGIIHHAVLEQFVGRLGDGERRLADLGDLELRDLLHASCQHVASQLSGGNVQAHARDAYQLRRTASQLARLLQAQRRVSAAGRTRPCRSELGFGMDDADSLPALTLTTPAGQRVQIRGFIDRVDVAELADEMLGVVIDYKRTRDKRLDLSHVYHGLSLQLLTYALVLAEQGETLAGRPIQPVAALYVSLLEKPKCVDHPDQANERAGAAVPRGLINADRWAVLEDGPTGRNANYYSMYFKKDGSEVREDIGDGATGPAFRAALAHTRRRLGELADGVLSGEVAVRPYRLNTLSPCSWCPMLAVCRFDPALVRVNRLASMSRKAVLAQLVQTYAAPATE